MSWENDDKMDAWLRVHYHTFFKGDSPEQSLMRLADQVHRLRNCPKEDAIRFAEKFLKGENMTEQQSDELLKIVDARGVKIEQLKAVNNDLYAEIEALKKVAVERTYDKSREKAFRDEIIGLKAIINYIKGDYDDYDTTY